MPIPIHENQPFSSVPVSLARRKRLVRRLAAYLVDLFAIYLLSLGTILALLAGYLVIREGGNMSLMGKVSAESNTAIFARIVHALIYFSYFTLAHWYFGQTIGKKIFKLRLRENNGNELSFSRSLGRTFGYLVSGQLTLGLGFAITYFRSDERSLHDILLNTSVADAESPQESGKVNPPDCIAA